MKHTYHKILSAVLAIVFGLTPVFALADTAGVSTDVTTGGGVSATATVSAKDAALITRGKDRGDKEIDRRTTSLNELLTRVQDMKNLSAADKTAIQTTVTNNVTALAQLKAKIDADTDLATLKADVQSILGSYRIFALILPQVRIIAAADRVVTVAGQMHLLSAKLSSRISAAAASGADMTAASAALTDFDAKVADAQVQAQAAVTIIATLAPDGGDKTKMAANTAALKDARAKVVAAQKDLMAARQDAQKIMAAVKGKPLTANATASSTTTTGQ